MSLDKLKSLPGFESCQGRVIFDIITEIQTLSARITILEKENYKLREQISSIQQTLVQVRTADNPKGSKGPVKQVNYLTDTSEPFGPEESDSDINFSSSE